MCVTLISMITTSSTTGKTK